MWGGCINSHVWWLPACPWKNHPVKQLLPHLQTPVMGHHRTKHQGCAGGWEFSNQHSHRATPGNTTQEIPTHFWPEQVNKAQLWLLQTVTTEVALPSETHLVFPLLKRMSWGILRTLPLCPDSEWGSCSDLAAPCPKYLQDAHSIKFSIPGGQQTELWSAEHGKDGLRLTEVIWRDPDLGATSKLS